MSMVGYLFQQFDVDNFQDIEWIDIFLYQELLYP